MNKNFKNSIENFFLNNKHINISNIQKNLTKISCEKRINYNIKLNEYNFYHQMMYDESSRYLPKFGNLIIDEQLNCHRYEDNNLTTNQIFNYQNNTMTYLPYGSYVNHDIIDDRHHPHNSHGFQYQTNIYSTNQYALSYTNNNIISQLQDARQFNE